MNDSMFVGAAIMTVFTVAGIFLVAALRSQHADELTRLAKHQKRLAEKQPGEQQQDIFAEKRTDFLARLLAEAGLEAKYDAMKSQWIMCTIGSAIGFMCLAFLLSPDLVIFGLILGAPAGAAGFVKYLNFLAGARQNKMTAQLPQVLESLVSSLRAGSPVVETFKVLSETAPEPIRSEFRRALISLQLGKSFRDAINEMSTRIRAQDFKLLAQAVFISQDVGANLADVVATIAEAIRARFKLRDAMNALTAQGKTTAIFVGVLPYGIAGITYLLSPGYMIPFLNNGLARIIICVLMIWEGIGFWILLKMVTFEV